jgi:hypothetical protein
MFRLGEGVKGPFRFFFKSDCIPILKGLFFKRAQLNLFGKYAVTKKFFLVLKESWLDSQTMMIIDIRQATRPWEKNQVGNFVAKNTSDIFHVQTSEAKSSPKFSFWRETK